MPKYQYTFGLPMDVNHRFLLNGKRFRIGNSGVRTMQLMDELLLLLTKKGSGKSLFSCRALIREVQYYESQSVLSFSISHANHLHARLLAIFLRGRCGGSLGTSTVFEYAKTNNDERTRKLATRALKRMGAWAQLQEIAETDPSEHVRCIATARPSDHYATRLNTFVRNVSPKAITHSQSTLYVAPGLEFDQGRKPKSASTIRAFLERIVRKIRGVHHSY